jgi:hypothetical protein
MRPLISTFWKLVPAGIEIVRHQFAIATACWRETPETIEIYRNHDITTARLASSMR